MSNDFHKNLPVKRARSERREIAKGRKQIIADVDVLTEDEEWDGMGPDQSRVLSYISLMGSVSRSCEAAGITRERFNRWRKTNEKFRGHLEYARTQPAATILEDAAWHRAVEGVDKPVFWQGEQVATVKEYSDPLLLAMLKATMPHKYGNKLEVKAPSGSNMTPPEPLFDVDSMSPEDRQQAAAIARRTIMRARVADAVDVTPTGEEDDNE